MLIELDSTREYYEKHAEDYFLATHSLDLHSLWSRLYKRLEANATILDFGCGSGRDLHYFTSQGFRVVGMDYTANLLKLAKGFTHQPLVLSDMRYPPFRQDTFEAVWAVASLLHLPAQAIQPVLAQIHRILKPNGIFLTTLKKGQGEAIDQFGRYTVFYLAPEWTTLLSQCGFDLIDLDEDVEVREVKPGHKTTINWIVSLARKYNHSPD